MRPFLAPPPDRSIGRGSVPTFSIVIPAFEVAQFVARAVESALAQKLPALEIIVADDGSTDDLAGALAPYRDRLMLLSGPHGGLPAARNRGYRAARGDFVANLDADDVVYPEWLEALAELAAARPDLDILTSDGYLAYDGERIRPCYSESWPFYVDDQPRRILEATFITSFAAVRRARFLELGGFDESIVTAWDLWLRLILDGSRAGCVEEALFEYTVRAGSISTRRLDPLRYGLRLLEKAEAEAVLEPRLRETLVQSIAGRRQELARLEIQEALAHDDPGVRRSALAAALDPGHPTRTRLKLAISALFPRTARRLLQRRVAREWVGAGGTRVKRI